MAPINRRFISQQYSCISYTLGLATAINFEAQIFSTNQKITVNYKWFHNVTNNWELMFDGNFAYFEFQNYRT